REDDIATVGADRGVRPHLRARFVSRQSWVPRTVERGFFSSTPGRHERVRTRVLAVRTQRHVHVPHVDIGVFVGVLRNELLGRIEGNVAPIGAYGWAFGAAEDQVRGIAFTLGVQRHLGTVGYERQVSGVAVIAEDPALATRARRFGVAIRNAVVFKEVGRARLEHDIAPVRRDCGIGRGGVPLFVGGIVYGDDFSSEPTRGRPIERVRRSSEHERTEHDHDARGENAAHGTDRRQKTGYDARHETAAHETDTRLRVETWLPALSEAVIVIV